MSDNGNQGRSFNKERTKREVLRTIGTAGAMVGGFSGSALAKEPKRSVEKVSGGKKRKYIGKVISSDEVKELREYVSTNLRPEPQSGQVRRITESGEEYLLVTVEFSVGGSIESSYFLTWNNRKSTRDYTVTEFNPETQTQRRFFFENGEVTELEESAEEIASEYTRKSGMLTTAQANYDPDDCVTWFQETCTDVNWSCLAGIGVTYGACATAALTGNLAGIIWCLSSIGVSIWQAADDEGCSTCDDSELVRREICGNVPSP